MQCITHPHTHTHTQTHIYSPAKPSSPIVLALTSGLTFGRQTAGLVDMQRNRSGFWIRLTWILFPLNTHTHTHTHTQIDRRVCFRYRSAGQVHRLPYL